MQHHIHPNSVTRQFQNRYPAAGILLDELDERRNKEVGHLLVIDRALARLGHEVVVGGSRAAGFSNKLLEARGVTDLDVGLVTNASRLLALAPQERMVAMDELIYDLLQIELGDHFVLSANRVERTQKSAFYQVVGRVDGEKIGQMGLDVDCDPHITTALTHSFEPFSSHRILGMPAGMRSFQSPNDIFAEKLLALKESTEAESKAGYAKHLRDIHQMLMTEGIIDPQLVAISLAELSRTTGVPVSDMYPPRYLRSASSRYRARRKKVSPGEEIPEHVMSSDHSEIKERLEPIVEAAQKGDRPLVLTRNDIAVALEMWVPPSRVSVNSGSVGVQPLTVSSVQSSFPKNSARPRTPPGRSDSVGPAQDRRGSKTSRSR